MTWPVLVPEALLGAAALGLLLLPRLLPRPAGARRWVRLASPAFASLLLLLAFGLELWLGATVTTLFGGGFVQDRFALFAKAALLLAAALALAGADWPAEDSQPAALALTLLGALGGMIAASAGDLVGLWAGLELAGLAGAALVGLRRPQAGIRLLLAGALGSALLAIGMAFLYASAGATRLDLIGRAFAGAAGVTLPLAVPVLLILAALGLRLLLAPFQYAAAEAALAGSPLGAALVAGLAPAAAAVVALRLLGSLAGLQAAWSWALAGAALLALLGGGLSALGARSLRGLIVSLAAGQAGWLAAGLSTHFRGGFAAALFLLGAFAVAATCAPALLGTADLPLGGLAGLAAARPARAAALALAALSLAGAPPLAGFFGEFAVAAELVRNGSVWLATAGGLGTLLATVAAVRALRVLYLEAPQAAEEAARPPGGDGPWTRLATGGAVALASVLAGYGLFAYPIHSLAVQGAAALGLR